MEFNNIIKKRRSVRDYIQREVRWEQISDVLEAGRWAPTSGNLQSYKFIVVGSKEKKKEISEATKKDWMQKASVNIVVCATLGPLAKLYGEKGTNNYAYQNIGAVMQTMCLKAFELKLGTCWVASFDPKKISEILSIPEDAKPIAILTLGHAKKQPSTPSKDPLSSLVWFEEWKGKRRAETKEHLSSTLKRGAERLKDVLESLKKDGK